VKKTIVLFDTLINNHTADELVAVIAHEVGHYKKKHILKNYVVSFLNMALMFYLLGLAFNDPVFSRMLGVYNSNFAVSMVGFFLLFQPVSFFTGILMNILSRKYEKSAWQCLKKTIYSKSFKLNSPSFLCIFPLFASACIGAIKSIE
jgi:STE24 endopeptidase